MRCCKVRRLVAPENVEGTKKKQYRLTIAHMRTTLPELSFGALGTMVAKNIRFRRNNGKLSLSDTTYSPHHGYSLYVFVDMSDPARWPNPPARMQWTHSKAP